MQSARLLARSGTAVRSSPLRPRPEPFPQKGTHMLQIKQICKQYKTGDLVQNALNNVSLNLRDNEFVTRAT